jgi:hypothetical protein
MPTSSFAPVIDWCNMQVSPTSRIQRFEDAKPLIGIDPTRKGLHYTGVAASAWVAVIFGGG